MKSKKKLITNDKPESRYAIIFMNVSTVVIKLLLKGLKDYINNHKDEISILKYPINNPCITSSNPGSLPFAVKKRVPRSVLRCTLFTGRQVHAVQSRC